MVLIQVLYRTALRALRVISPMLMRGESKLARGLRGKRDAHERLVGWGLGGRRDGEGEGDGGASATVLVDRPVVWVHASSVGESIQAQAVIDVLRTRVPDLQVVFTFFSPSAEAAGESLRADVSSYLPWDLPELMGPVLDAVRPFLIVFTQREVWPTLSAEAAARGVPTVLIAGTLPEGAGRLSRLGKILLGPAFGSLRAVAAVSREDGDRFRLLGVSSDRVTVTGDPGIDAALVRVAAIDHGASHMRIFAARPGPILVAGSTWPSDEKVLIPALVRVREAVPDLRIVLVPHEPEGYDFAALQRRLEADGWTPARLGEVEAAAGAPEVEGPSAASVVESGRAIEVDVATGALEARAASGVDSVLVDRVGVLADLYSLASVAYVGGGFHGEGLHSVLEPAASGVPVLIGPRYQASVHATGLLAVGAARSVSNTSRLAETLRELLDARRDGGPDPAEKNEDPGQRAMDYIENQRGSAESTADLITQFFPQETRRGTLSEGET